MDITVKQEKPDFLDSEEASNCTLNVSPIYISDSSSSSSSSDDDSDIDDSFLDSIFSGCDNYKKRDLGELENGNLSRKKPKLDGECSISSVALSPEFLSFIPTPMPLYFVAPEPITQAEPVPPESVSESIQVAAVAVAPLNINYQEAPAPILRSCRQFWKAGDYDCNGSNADDSSLNSGMDHLRVHPKFLHSNATSHKWALGAFAELLDNSLDEVCNGATYVHVDTGKNKKDGTNMLLFEDNGGGMTPDKMRQCMSLGYSAKSKMANTIGQYGNGFKTSTMRLGADVIVFSHCPGHGESSSTRSIGMLSYSFLMGTGKQDIVVPMIDYEKKGQSWNKLIRSSLDDWNRNLETIIQWSPYTSEEDLFQQFKFSGDQGTRVIIYNLWEDDEGLLELDFDSDPHDIQVRGVNRDEKSIEMAKKYPNSRHYLTYRHSLRSYASILYLRLPANFRIILRGKDVEHHDLVNDMMLTKETTYKPLHLPDRVPKDLNMVAATVTLGFVKDARHHIDIQGFNVYHKNRLIKPFWRVWNPAGSDGRGVIGVLEANFVEPAHDKQGFERTPVLCRLEARLVAIQKNYWATNCQEIGYAARRNSKAKTDSRTPDKDKSSSLSSQNRRDFSNPKTKLVNEFYKGSPQATDTSEDESSHETSPAYDQSLVGTGLNGTLSLQIPRATRSGFRSHSHSKTHAEGLAFSGDKQSPPDCDTENVIKLKENNQESKESLKRNDSTRKDDRLERNEGPTKDDLQSDLEMEREKCRTLENQLMETQDQLEKAKQRIEEMDQEQIVLVDIIQEERERRNAEEERLRNQIREASDVISRLVEKVRQLEAGRTLRSCKIER